MADLYQNKYRIASARLQSWNYANQGLYFVTICTKNREFYFGDIADGIMHLLEIGKIADTVVEHEWWQAPVLRPDMNLNLGEFVVMPNHVHGIIGIGTNEYNGAGTMGRDAMHGVSTHGTVNQFGPQRKNLASIIRGYKSAVTTWARKQGLEFGWQERYNDHIIRSADEHRRISAYIRTNPANWKDDGFFR